MEKTTAESGCHYLQPFSSYALRIYDGWYSPVGA